jgi:acetoin utilization deacetylase AcuC-like enzyme
MIVVSSPDGQRQHSPQTEFESSRLQVPFEHPGRADAIHAVLSTDDRFEVREPHEWGTAPIEAVHDPGLVQFLRRAWTEYQLEHPDTHDVIPDVFQLPGLMAGMGGFNEPTTIDLELGRWCFETTTPITQGTFRAATSAVDVALSATEEVLAGALNAYGLCRPPGHHAPTGLYGGYCFFNNAAVAANHIASTTGSKVTILDVDYHHGNGTQQICYARGDIQYVSLHGDPARAYPYITGFADERGTGKGLGSNLNLPMPRLADDELYLSGLATACAAIDAFAPAVVVVSLGLDAYFNDPISDLAITSDGFERQGAIVAELQRPTVVLQEGGYDVAALGTNVQRWLLGLENG